MSAEFIKKFTFNGQEEHLGSGKTPLTLLNRGASSEGTPAPAIAIISLNHGGSSTPELKYVTPAFSSLDTVILHELDKLLSLPVIEHEGRTYNILEAITSTKFVYTPSPLIFIANDKCYQCNAACTQDATGEIVFLAQIQEATVKQATEAFMQEREQKIKAEKRAQRLSKYSGLLIHDLRTPLTSIIGTNQLIQLKLKNKAFIDENNIAQLSNLTGIVNKQSWMMNSQITEVLNIFRASEYPKPIILSPSSLLESVTEKNTELLETKGIGLIVDAPDDLPQVCLAKRLFVLVQNTLVLNAAQAVTGREDGKIILKARVEDGNVIFSVEDNGKGMDADALERCFTEHNSSTGGSGMMLAISKEIVEEELNGRIKAESIPGVGTTFSTYIPIYKPESQALFTQPLNN